MEQQRYGFNKEPGTKGTALRAAIFHSFYLFHIWPGRIKALHVLVVSGSRESTVSLLLWSQGLGGPCGFRPLAPASMLLL